MYQAPRGTQDILPEEQAYRCYIEQKAADICRLYGYKRLDTPIFEDTHLFIKGTGETTDIVQKEMYTFEDRGGNSLTLKPEGTPSVCRAYLEHGFQNLPQPVKLYYIAPFFRYERPQAGRFRQHYGFGAEAIGEGDPALDAEVIDMAWQFFLSLCLVSLNLQLTSIGCRRCRPDYLKALENFYSTAEEQFCQECGMRLHRNPLRLLDCKKPLCQQISASAPKSIDYLCTECKEHFDRLTGYLTILGIPYNINHRLVRGLDYYTRTVFEIQPDVEGAQSTLAGGGRYDGLIEELGGKPTPAIGFASGIERVTLNLKRQNVTVPPVPGPNVFIAGIGNAARSEVLKQAVALRRAGIGVLTVLGEKSLKAQLRQANSLGVKFTVIIGEAELKSGNAILRNMETAEQQTVGIQELTNRLVV
jgi:histidyl-tRNA synthetase